MNKTDYEIAKKSWVGRFIGEIAKDSECWDWIGPKFPNGYCYVNNEGRCRSAAACVREVCNKPPQIGSRVYPACGNRNCVNPSHCLDAKERFFSLIGPKNENTGCMEWQGGKTDFGHGRFSVMHKSNLSHRLVWEFVNGAIPEGLVIRHLCNNPACCNIEHLATGTQAENMQDRQESGRTASGDRSGAKTMPHRVCKGESHGMAKLKESDIHEIRECYLAGMTTYEIGEKFSIDPSHAGDIVNGKLWSNVPLENGYQEKASEIKKTRDKSTKGSAHYKTKLTESLVVEIREAASAGIETLQQIGERFGINYSTASDIARGKSWKHAGGPITKNRPRPQNSNYASGSKQGSSKVNEEIVAEIRSKFASGEENQGELSRRLGLHQTTVSDIVRRKSWKHVS